MKAKTMKKTRILAEKCSSKTSPADGVHLEVVKQLTAALGDHGILVRREELKRGPGWRAVSGMCRAKEQRIVFLDRHLPHQEQVAFLTSKISELRLSLAPERMDQLPESVKHQLAA